jgi:hypothetical protein
VYDPGAPGRYRCSVESSRAACRYEQGNLDDVRSGSQAFEPLQIGTNRFRKSTHVALGQVFRQQRHEAGFEVRPGEAFVFSQKVGVPGHQGERLVGPSEPCLSLLSAPDSCTTFGT